MAARAGDTFAMGFAVAAGGAVAMSALMYHLQTGMSGWPHAADEEEKEDTVADVPQVQSAGNDGGFGGGGVLTPEGTEVGGDTPEEWGGALDDEDDMDIAVGKAPDVDWLAAGALPTSSRDEEDFNLEFMRSTSGMSGISSLERGASAESLTSLIPSPRGWDTGSAVPLPGSEMDDAPETNLGKRARTSSSPRGGVPPSGHPLDASASAPPPDGSARGSGEHMVHMVRHNQIPAGVIDKALPAELAFALLDSTNFEPGARPAIFDADKAQFLFKELTVGGKPSKPGGPDATKADRWHNSGGIKGSRDMPPNLPLVRRRYGAVVQADGSKGFRYHEYTRVRIVESLAIDGSGRMERTIAEDRSVVLFHVMPKRTEKGRPSKSETEAPAKLWASLGLGLQQEGASVVPTHGQVQQPTIIRQASATASPGVPPIPASVSPAGTATPPRGPSGLSAGDELPWLRANHSAASVAQGRPILAMCAPPMERVASEYISFQKGSQVLGQISQTADGRGVTLQSVGADVAEWHRVDPTARSSFEEGEIVGVHAAGVSRVTSGASVVGVVSHQAIVKGGMPTDSGEYESVAYVGRLPMRVRGGVRVGDALVPSGLNDGVAVAATVSSHAICRCV